MAERAALINGERSSRVAQEAAGTLPLAEGVRGPSLLVLLPTSGVRQMRLTQPMRVGGALTLIVLAAGAADTARAQGGTWALTNARIETVTRGVIDRGTVLIRDGLIAAVGANVTVPADARVLDLTGRPAYPGLIDLNTTLALPAPA